MAIRARYEGGKLGIYTVPSLASTDNTPLSDPVTNISRVKFHSDFEYTGVKSETSGTLTLPTRGADTQVRVDHQLFAHGQASAPMVFGKLTGVYTNQGGPYTLPITGDVALPIPVGNGKYANNTNLHRWVSLLVDDTYVYLREYGMVMGSGWNQPDGQYIACKYGYRSSSSATTSPFNGDSGSSITGWPSQTINWTVAVTQYLVTGPASGYDAALPDFKLSGSVAQFGRGKFRGENGYIGRTTSTNCYAIPNEKHFRPVSVGEQIVMNDVVVAGRPHVILLSGTIPLAPTTPEFTPSIEKVAK